MVSHAEKHISERMLRRDAGLGWRGARGRSAAERLHRAAGRFLRDGSEGSASRGSWKRAREGLDVLGVFHSHPDCDAYFSKRDLENSCSWFSYVVLSIKNGRFDHANSYRPDFDQKEAPKEELIYG